MGVPQVGDVFKVLHSDRRGTTLAPLAVRAVKRLNDGRFRLTFDRDHPDFPTVEVVVDSSGRDVNGYVEPVAVAAPGAVVRFAGSRRVVESVEDRGVVPNQDRYRVTFTDGLTTTHPSALFQRGA